MIGNSFDQLIASFVPQGKFQRSWSLTGGTSVDMTVLEFVDAARLVQKIILRRPRTDVQASTLYHEYLLLQIMQSAGLATPKAYHFDDSGKILPVPFLLLEYVEGDMLFKPVIVADYMRQLASHLAQIHQVDYRGVDLSFLPKRPYHCPELTRKRPSATHPFFPYKQIQTWLATHPPTKQKNSSTLLHGDYWPGNALWQDGQLVAVIDWEDAELGDPLCDLTKSRSEIAWLFGIEAMHVFTHHYQSQMDLDYTDLPYWDLCAVLRLLRFLADDLAEAGAFFIPYGRQDIDERMIQENVTAFIEQAFVAG